LAPHNFVAPLHLAIVRLDAAQHARAREALERAARLAPDNPLVAGYLDLIAWAEGEHGRLDGLGRRARELPESFRARLLLHLAAWTLRTRGGKAAVALLEPPPDRPLAIRLPAPLRARWHRRRGARRRRGGRWPRRRRGDWPSWTSSAANSSRLCNTVERRGRRGPRGRRTAWRGSRCSASGGGGRRGIGSRIFSPMPCFPSKSRSR